ncbi:hypothetical protein ACL02S_05615 [Nocardia sp. 004]|uniref:hypothetical protein n=1 Tax=Nocardia sp. 004 TaxID=3385978 RepID=UPI0039A0EBE7
MTRKKWPDLRARKIGSRAVPIDLSPAARAEIKEIQQIKQESLKEELEHREREVKRYYEEEIGVENGIGTGGDEGAEENEGAKKKKKKKESIKRYLDSIRGGSVSGSKIRKLENLTQLYLQTFNNLNRLSEEAGEVAARDYIEQRIAEGGGSFVIEGDDERPGKDKRNVFDLVAVIDGKLVLIEAKGPSAGLGSRWVKGKSGNHVYAQQGTREYLEATLASDEYLLQKLKDDHPEIYQALYDGTAQIEYRMVRATKAGGANTQLFDIGEHPVGLPARFPKGAVPPEGYRGEKGLQSESRSIPDSRGAGSNGGKPGDRRSAPQRTGFAATALLAGAFVSAMVFGGGSPEAHAASAHDTTSVVQASNAHVVSANSATAGLKDWAASARDSAGVHKLFKEGVGGSGTQKLASDVGMFSGVLQSISIATQVWAVAQWAFNIAMNANPIGALLVAALTLAITNITLVVTYWDTFRSALDWVFKNVLMPMGQWFSDTWNDTLVPIFQSCADAVSAVFRTIADSISGAWNWIVDQVRGFLRGFADFIDRIPYAGIGPNPHEWADRIREFTDPGQGDDDGVPRDEGEPGEYSVLASAPEGASAVDVASRPQNVPVPETADYGAAPGFAAGGLVSLPVWRGVGWGLEIPESPAGFAVPHGSVEAGADRAGAGSGQARRSVSRRRRAGRARASSVAARASGTAALVAAAAAAHRAGSVMRAGVVGRNAGGVSGSGSGFEVDGSDALAVDRAFAASSVFEHFASGDGDGAARLLAAGGSVSRGSGSAGGFPDANLSLLQVISQDAGVLSGVRGRQVVPTRALGAGGVRRRNTRMDRSLAIRISAPDVDAEFRQVKANTARRALTYAGRWS